MYIQAPEGSIRIDAKAENSGPVSILQIGISDGGAPFDAKSLAKVFDPFFTKKAGRKGSRCSGLELPVAKCLAELLGGGVSVACPQGGGVLYTVRLPSKPD